MLLPADLNNVIHSVILCPCSVQQDRCIFFVDVAMASPNLVKHKVSNIRTMEDPITLHYPHIFCHF